MPEVESTSRRTGLQLGLAAVTEPNTGDIAVKLKDKRSRGHRRGHQRRSREGDRRQEPALDVDFTQVLQDMIGDLTGAPQPVVVKLFSPDADLLATWAPQVADALGKIYVNGKKPVVDIEDGIENTTSGPAVVFTVNPTGGREGRIHDRSTDDCRVGDRRRRTRHDAGDHQRPSLHAARPLPGGKPRRRSKR